MDNPSLLHLLSLNKNLSLNIKLTLFWYQIGNCDFKRLIIISSLVSFLTYYGGTIISWIFCSNFIFKGSTPWSNWLTSSPEFSAWSWSETYWFSSCFGDIWFSYCSRGIWISYNCRVSLFFSWSRDISLFWGLISWWIWLIFDINSFTSSVYFYLRNSYCFSDI